MKILQSLTKDKNGKFVVTLKEQYPLIVLGEGDERYIVFDQTAKKVTTIRKSSVQSDEEGKKNAGGYIKMYEVNDIPVELLTNQ